MLFDIVLSAFLIDLYKMLLNKTPNQIGYLSFSLMFLFGLFLTGCNHARYANSKIKPGIYDRDQVDYSYYQLNDETKDLGEEMSKMFEVKADIQDQLFSTEEEIAKASEQIYPGYLLGAGDVLALQVWGRPDISQEAIVVTPDGNISVPRIGYMNVLNKTIEETTEIIREKLKFFYTDPEVVLKLKETNNNKAFVLGRVSSPGLVKFTGQGTLMEALAMSGGLPILATDSFLTKCSIIRGKNTIFWIDLRDLLNNGNVALNMPIKNNDIIFIPESENEVIYVMGEVLHPGAVRLKTKLSLMDALMYSGGPTFEANVGCVYIIRNYKKRGYVQHIDLNQLLVKGDFSKNFVLQANDVVFVSQSKISKWNYLMTNISPSLQVMNLGTSVAESFGVMQQVRRSLFGQNGFVNSTR